MRREITTASVKIVHICDLCAVQADVDHCWLCRKEVCYKCRTLMFCGKHDDWVDLPMKVCRGCKEGHDRLIEKLQAILDGANNELRHVVVVVDVDTGGIVARDPYK